MSQSRADRRRSARAGSQPPGKRDPMVPIYIGIAVLVALIFIGFGISNAVASHQRDQAIAFDLSTPSPGPTPTIKPIQLKDGQPVGVASGFATPNPKKGQLTNTKTGGQGLPVDGIPCETSEQVAMHVHTHLTVIVRGKVVQVPEYIGFAPSAGTICLYWLHTHDASGIIHIEAADASAPSGGPYTLGMFFDIWGQQLGANQVGPFKGPVTAYVNGVPYAGKLGDIPLRSHQLITLEVGTPVIPPPNYILPKGD